MREIPLTQGKVSLVDDEDYERLMKFKWYYRYDGYAIRMINQSNKIKEKATTQRMHRVLLNPPKGMDIDHIDGDGLNNRRSNLRICTRTENSLNCGRSRINKSGYKGVCLKKKTGKWFAQIQIEGKKIHLGYYENILDAAFAYEKVAKENYGEFYRPQEIGVV